DAPGDSAPDVTAMDLAAADAATDPPADTTVGADAAADAAGPMLVTVQFSGQVVTVAGAPLGLDNSVRLAPVTGSFAYDLRITDNTPLDPTRGRYLHAAYAPSQFTFNVSGHVVTGSGLAIVDIENFPGADTFRFRDGPQNDGVTRIMKLD